MKTKESIMPAEHQPTRRQRIIYRVMPLFLLIVCLGAINLVSRQRASSSEALTAPLPAQVAKTTPPVSAPAATAVPTLIPGQPTAMPTAVPALPPEVSIQLLGPPENAVFQTNNAISFYWHWDAPLADGQQFAVYLKQDDKEMVVGFLDEPNVGSSYRINITIGDKVNAGSAQWQVRLEADYTAGNLLVSELRPFTLLSNSSP
jgi:hypothetical protein